MKRRKPNGRKPGGHKPIIPEPILSKPGNAVVAGKPKSNAGKRNNGPLRKPGKKIKGPKLHAVTDSFRRIVKNVISQKTVIGKVKAGARAGGRMLFSFPFTPKRSLLMALYMHHPPSYRHSLHVRDYALGIYGELGANITRGLAREALENATMMHDVGKLDLHRELLNNSRITPGDYAKLKKHVRRGVKMTRKILSPEEVEIIKMHQEQWSGEGYPKHAKGKEIPLGARILSVADAFSAMTDYRGYNAGNERAPKEAFVEIKKLSGKSYQPIVVDAFERYLRKKGILKTQ